MSTPPRWLTPALGLWVVLGTVAITALTSVPLHAAVPTAALAALGLAHGMVHRRWRVAGPVAGALFAAATVAALGWLPAGVDLTYEGGPAGSAAPKMIWAAVVVVVGLEIGWALVLHARRPPPPVVPPAPPALDPHLRDLARRVDRVEHLLTRVD